MISLLHIIKKTNKQTVSIKLQFGILFSLFMICLYYCFSNVILLQPLKLLCFKVKRFTKHEFGYKFDKNRRRIKTVMDN